MAEKEQKAENNNRVVNKDNTEVEAKKAKGQKRLRRAKNSRPG